MHHPGSRAPLLRRPAVTALAGLVMAGGLTVALAGGPAGAASRPRSPSAGLSAFRTCMAQHGVTLRTPRRASGTTPSGPPPGIGGSRPPGGFPGFAGGRNSKQAKALAACRSKLPSGGSGARFGGTGAPFTPTPAQQQALATFEQCMDAHGVKIASGATIQTIRSLLRADPAAAQACQGDLRGVFGPPPGTSGHASGTGASNPA